MFDEQYDWVVVGSGGGALCSALKMADLGKRVLVLEKTEYVGGTTARSGGVMWLPNNPFMAEAGISDSTELAHLYLDTLVGEDPSAKGTSKLRRDTYLRECLKMLAFVRSKGLQFHRHAYWPDYHTELPGASEPGRTVLPKPFNIRRLGQWQNKLRPGFLLFPAHMDEAIEVPRQRYQFRSRLIMLRVGLRLIWDKITGAKRVGAGMALQGAMLEAVLAAGVDIRTNTPVVELIEEQGRVTGVLATINGEQKSIGANLGVLVNAGGFAHNQSMRDQYIPGTSTEWTSASPGDTGEMINTMASHGAALAQMNERVGNQTTLPPGAEKADFKPGAQQLTAGPHALLVDQTGVRYMNEGGSYMSYCQKMLERNQQVPAIPSWAIFDAQYVARYQLAGVNPTPKRLQAWRESGYLKQADSIAELAEAISVPADALDATVNRFNGFVVNNRDEDFGRGERAYDHWLGDPTLKPSSTMAAINKGPYYAVPVYPGDVSTYGGVVTNEHSQVLREDNTVIEGLYASGVSTASVMGRAYPGAGASVGPSFTWGFVAAKHAAKAEQ